MNKKLIVAVGVAAISIGAFAGHHGGRINFGPYLFDKKGLKNVRIGSRYINNWKIHTLPMKNVDELKFKKIDDALTDKPCFYKGEIFVDEVCDSFLRVDGFTKGFVTVNGKNLGRYYTSAGPQRSFYVPSCWLKQGKNEVIIFDSDGAKGLNAEFVDAPAL